MIWKDGALATREDFVEAMVNINDRKEAERFKAIFRHNFHNHADDVLGYITGEMHPSERKRVTTLFGVRHPFEEHLQSPTDMLHAGIAMGLDTPAWFRAAMAIPRRLRSTS